MVSRLALYLLGAPQIECDGAPIKVRRRKAMALLAYLAVTGRRHRRDALAALFWPEHDQGAARASLRRALFSIKKALGPGWLEADRESVGLQPEAGVWLDVAEFRARLAQGRTHSHPPDQVCPACLSSLTEAAALYRDDFLAGFTLRDSPAFDDWQFFQTEGLRDELAGALERLAQELADQDELDLAIEYARRRVALDPLHEPAHRHLMQLYAQAGQRAAALRQYQECAGILETELGLPPSETTTALYQQVRTRVAGHEPPSPATRPGSQPQLTKLPVQATPFIGRQVHVAAVCQELARPEVRLLTLTGAGGTGKTRLSLQVAAEFVDGGLSPFKDGVCFVGLAPVRDAALVMHTLAQTLRVRKVEGQSLLDSLKGYLEDKQMLLLLDNFEHVMAAAPMVNELLAAAPQLKVLATSRASLRVYGEHEYAVPPMTTSDPRSLLPLEKLAQVESMQLFAQRARAVKGDFTLTDENAPTVAEICARLDGLPLAIELAAARVRLLPPREILPRLDNLFGFLTGGARDLPARQQTLRAMIDWSHDLLEEDEKTLFRRLAVFVGGCSLDAIETVCNPSQSPGTSVDLTRIPDILCGLEGLVDKNLLVQAVVHDQPRFGMLETIREYALEQLAGSREAERLQQRHAGYFVSLAEGTEAEQDGPKPAAWLSRLDVEHNNFRAALAWSLENAGDVAVRLAGALGRYWTLRGKNAEGREWLDRALAVGRRQGSDLDYYHAKALYEAGELVWCQGDFDAAATLEGESVALWRSLGDKRGLARALCMLGAAVYTQGGLQRARSLLEESVALSRQTDDPAGLAKALFWLGHLTHVEFDYKAARACSHESRDLAWKIGALIWTAASTGTLGRIAFDQGDYAAAQSLIQESLDLYRESEDAVGIAIMVQTLAEILCIRGRYERAKALYEEGIALQREMGNEAYVAWQQCCLGYVSLHLEQWQQAQAHFLQSMTVLRKAMLKQGIGACLAGLATLAEQEGQPEQAARLLGAAEGLLEASYRRPPMLVVDEIVRPSFDATAAAVRALMDEQTFAAAWAEGQAQDVEVWPPA